VRGTRPVKVAVMDTVIGGDDDSESFARARRVCFEGVEIDLTREELRSPDSQRLRRLQRARAATGLAVHSLVLGEHSDGGIADRDSSVAEAASDDIRRATAWAAELGADAILVPFFGRGELGGDDDLERAAAAFRQLCPLAAARGVTLCYEGTLPAGRIFALAERVASPAFGCYFDVANVVVRGFDTATEIGALGDLIERVHMKDTRAQPGDVPLGLGRVDYAASANALAETGYDGWITLETPPGPPPLVARDLSFTRTVFPQLRNGIAWPRFGAFSYDFPRGQWDRLCASFHELRLEAVQLGDELLDELLEQPEAMRPARARLDEQGLTVTALAGYRNLVAPDPGRRSLNIEALARCLELAPLLGTWVVATETGTRHPEADWTDSPDNWAPDTWRLLEDALETLLPVAERCGTILALEAHVKNVLKTHGQLIGLLKRFPSRHLQVVCDPYNYLSSHLVPAQARVTADFLERFEHRFVIAHLKDIDPGGADVGTIELGTGIFEQAPYLRFLRERRPDLDLIVEHQPLDHIPQVLARIRDLVSDT
jgi:L-ribulose-5-phosphate 3-epimerase